MPLSPNEVIALSRLLDEGLEIDSKDRAAWLAALPAQHAPLAHRLAEMLGEQDQLTGSSGPLSSLPQVVGDESVARSGDRVGPYRLLRQIGQGGMGSVWFAERADGAYQRQVALKLPRLAWGGGLAERMAREREIGMLLEHPNIARLYDAGVDEHGRPYLALEFVDGQPIDALCEAQALTTRGRLRLFLQVVRAVAYAHGRLVVHRDLKPSNVLVTPDGQAHLLDFGIAKLLQEAGAGDEGLTQQQGRVMTPQYASPEQVAGDPVTVQSDVYSLGVLLYELLTGTLPIEPKRRSLGAVEDAILQGDAQPASSRTKDRAVARALRGEVDAILAKAMHREVARRYATADAMGLDIQRHLDGETVSAKPDSPLYRLRKAIRRHWVSVAAVSAVMAAVLSGSAIAVVQAQRAARSAEREQVVKQFVTDVFRVSGRTDPANAAVRPASPMALVEGGAQLIQQRFAGQPALQAELYGLVGGVFSDMGAYGLAADYASRRSETLATLKAEPAEQAQGLVALGQAQFDDRRYTDAEPRARRAVELADKGTPTYLDALVLIARIQERVSRLDGLAITLKEIDALVQKQAPSPSRFRSWLRFLQARQLDLSNRFDGALPMYLQAIDDALASEGPLSVTAIEQRLIFVGRLTAMGETGADRVQFDAAQKALRQLGGPHEIRATLSRVDFASNGLELGTAADTRAALAVFEQSRAELASTNLPVPQRFLGQVDLEHASALIIVGEMDRARHLMERALPMVRPSWTTVADQVWLIGMEGRIASYQGQHERADRLLREALEFGQRQRGKDHPYVQFLHANIARNLLRQGLWREADVVLDQMPKSGPHRGNVRSESEVSRHLSLTRADVKLVAGRPAEALESLKLAQPDVNEDPNVWANYRASLGEAQCEAGWRSEGIVQLKLAEERHQISSFPQAPWLIRVRAQIGLCAVAAGDRATATRYALLAREGITAQPQLSPYYTDPVVKLEKALGIRALLVPTRGT